MHYSTYIQNWFDNVLGSSEKMVFNVKYKSGWRHLFLPFSSDSVHRLISVQQVGCFG